MFVDHSVLSEHCLCFADLRRPGPQEQAPADLALARLQVGQELPKTRTMKDLYPFWIANKTARVV